MTQTPNPADTAHRQTARTGVLLVNLGTPEQAQPSSVGRYLREFLSDPRVVEIPRAIWLPLLYGVIVPLRQRKSAEAYQSIWTEQGSPLMVYSQQLAEGIRDRAQALGHDVELALAMRYGRPSIAAALHGMRERGMRRLLVLPLYPQYSATTTASVFDAVQKELGQWRWPPELRQINDYYREDAWLDAVAASIEAGFAAHGKPDRLLFSFHGLPRRNLELGDPYHCQCVASARMLAERLGLARNEWEIGFQSRFGKAEWLKPYAEPMLQRWAREGVGHVQVVCPGFAADCLETLEEIAERYRESYLAAGGQRLEYIPALNATPAHVNALWTLLERHLSGWPTRPAETETTPDQCVRRVAEYAQHREAHPE